MLSSCANPCCEKHSHSDYEISEATHLLHFTCYEYYQGNHLGSFWGLKVQNRLDPFGLST